MNCQEVHSHYTEFTRIGDGYRVETAEIAAHVDSCADCARFAEAQKDLGSRLRWVVDSIPEPPASLDHAVLALYRRHIAEQRLSKGLRPRDWRSSIAVQRWSAGVAAGVILLMTLFLSWNRHTSQPKAGVTATAVSPPTEGGLRVSGPVPAPGREGSYVSPPTVRHQHRAPLPEGRVDPLPVGFNSLMYCDELSCSGAMEMIRVQLPSSAAFPSPSASAVVFADVLVGSDGIARGIRVVE